MYFLLAFIFTYIITSPDSCVIKKQRKLKLSYTKEEFDKLPCHVQGKLYSSAPQIYHWYERKDKNRLVECKYCKKSYQFRNKQ